MSDKDPAVVPEWSGPSTEADDAEDYGDGYLVAPAVVPDVETARTRRREWEALEADIRAIVHPKDFHAIGTAISTRRRNIEAAIRAEGRGALDLNVRTLIETTSPYRNCQYGHAFRAPCPDVGHNTESWCRFCQAHARLTALAQREPAESPSEPCPYCDGSGCLPCHGRGTVGPYFRSNRGLPPYRSDRSEPPEHSRSGDWQSADGSWHYDDYPT